MAKIRKLTEKELAQLVVFTPDEQADSDRFEAENPHLEELQAAIDKAKNPKVRATLEAEMANRTAPKITQVPPEDFADVPKPKISKVDAAQFQPDVSNPTDEMGVGTRLAAGIGSGLFDLYRGTKQTGLSALDYVMSKTAPESEVAKWAGSAKKENQAAIDEQARLDKNLLNTTSGRIGNIIGQSVPMMAIPGLGGAGVASTFGGALVRGGAQGAMNAALTSRESGEDPLRFWGANVAGGMGGNALLHGGSAFVNGVRNKFRDFPNTMGHQATPVEAYQALKQQGIPSSIGDIAPTSWWRDFENLSEKYIPFSGREGAMERQAQSVSDRLKTVQSQNQGKAKGQKIVSKAVDEALDPNRPGSLSTKAFLDELKLTPAYRAKVFPGQMGQEVGSLETAMRAANRVDRYASEEAAKTPNLRTVMGGIGLGLPGVGAAMHIPYGAPMLAAGAGISGLSRIANGISNSDLGKRMYLADPQALSRLTKAGTRALPSAWEDYLNQQLYGQ
jgi:hypothetical protein